MVAGWPPTPVSSAMSMGAQAMVDEAISAAPPKTARPARAGVRKTEPIAHPIATAGMTHDDIPRLRDSARAIIGSAVAELRMELAS